MRWAAREEAPDPRLEWHRWFAWHPVQIDDRWVWLEHVERKLWFWYDWDDGCFCVREYRELSA